MPDGRGFCHLECAEEWGHRIDAGLCVRCESPVERGSWHCNGCMAAGAWLPYLGYPGEP